MEVSGQLHAPAALPPGKEPLVPIDCVLFSLKLDNTSAVEENIHLFGTKMFITVFQTSAIGPCPELFHKVQCLHTLFLYEQL
jgi:hypothetical protein